MEQVKQQIAKDLDGLDFHATVSYINELRAYIHSLSPFKNEPVDFVRWEIAHNVVANDYNPNKVAPPEMELLEVSIMNDGYTQPIVTWRNEEKHKTEVIDGFHRNRVGKESKVVQQRIRGYLPVVDIRKEQSGKNDRIASTIRHNRARGKHQVDAMSEIVIELKNRNWTNARIAKQLGMDEEEILRLCQISGLEQLFSDKDFSRSWEAPDELDEYIPITDDIDPGEVAAYRTANTSDPKRIFHTFDKWECHKAGFYQNTKEGMSHEECEAEYVRILTDQKLFASILEKVTSEWVYSCEHYLTNVAMNRIAWLGQAAVCYESGVPARYSSAWSRIPKEDQEKANQTALNALNNWLEKHTLETVDMDAASSYGRQLEIY